MPTVCLQPGGGYLVYLSDGDVPFFRVAFSPISSRRGYQKKANFLDRTNLGQVPATGSTGNEWDFLQNMIGRKGLKNAHQKPVFKCCLYHTDIKQKNFISRGPLSLKNSSKILQKSSCFREFL